jgi:hypothetical protein
MREARDQMVRVGPPLDYADGRPAARAVWMSRWLASPPGPALHALTGLALLLTFAATYVPGGQFALIMLVIPAWLALLAAWFVRALAAAVLALRHRARDVAPRRLVHWLVLPAVLLLAIVCVHFDLPYRAALRLSRPAMDRWAEQVLAETPPATTMPATPAMRMNVVPRRAHAGLFPVGEAERLPTGFRFSIAGAGFIDTEGFAYSTTPLPPRDGSDRYQPIGGNWYRWHWHF